MPRTLLAAWLLLGATAAAQDPVELSSHIDAVTVYPSSARVQRLTDPVPGSGQYALRGLPSSLEPESVRVRCRGGHVVAVEVRERLEDRTPEARVQELRDELRAVQQTLAGLRDELAVGERMRHHLEGLLARAGSAEEEEIAGGSASIDEWARRHDFIAEGLRANLAERRERLAKIEESEARRRRLEEELGRAQSGNAVSLRDLLVKVVVPDGGRPLEVEYLVGGASWRPRYDVRAAEDGRSAKLAYRGEVRQGSGEDWTDVQLFLSSAEPKRSARGPELEGRWARLVDPRARHALADSRSADRYEAEGSMERLKSLGYVSGENARKGEEPPFATVTDEGLSVRFAVRGRDSVTSGGSATTVLVGEAPLSIEPEYFCAPALDPTVWLRGHTENDTEWPILAGEASVFLGEDFLGRARLETALRGQSFTVPLGAADAIACERVQTTDHSKGPGIFGKSRREVSGWRTTFTNAGASIAAADGSVGVVVREAIPKPTDESIEVKLEGLSHAVARAEKWRKDAAELGIETWVLRVPAHGEVELRYELVVTHPQDRAVIYR